MTFGFFDLPALDGKYDLEITVDTNSETY